MDTGCLKEGGGFDSICSKDKMKFRESKGTLLVEDVKYMIRHDELDQSLLLYVQFSAAAGKVKSSSLKRRSS